MNALLQRVALAAAVLVGGSCSVDPGSAKLRLLEIGNNYQTAGQYRYADLCYRKAIRLDRRFGEAYYRLALMKLKQKEHLQAAGALWRAYELGAGEGDVYRMLADIYLAMYVASGGRERRLLDELTRLTNMERARNPGSIDATRVDGSIALAEGFFEEAIPRFEAFLEQRPGDRRTTLALCHALGAAGRPAEAETVAREALKRDPNYLPFYDYLYRLDAKAGRQYDAWAIRQAAVDNLPDSLPAWIAYAAHLQQVGRMADVDRVLDYLEADSEFFGDAYLTIGRFCVLTNQLDRAIEKYAADMRRDPARKRSYQAGILDALMLSGARDEVMCLLDEILAENPADADAYVIRAVMRADRTGEEGGSLAITDFLAALRLKPDNPFLRFALGEAYLRLRDAMNAEKQFKEALYLQPLYNLPKLALANLYLAEHRFVRTVALAEEVLEQEPGHNGARLLLTEAWTDLREYEKAHAELDRILEFEPENVPALLLLAELSLAEGRLPKAVEYYYSAHQRDRSDPRGLQRLVRALVMAGRAGEAREVLRTELEFAPERAGLRMALADLAAYLGDSKTAIAEYQRLIDSDPKNARAHLRLGEIFMRANLLGLAESSFSRALELEPGLAAAYVQLGVVKTATGDPVEARRLYERALAIDPDLTIALNNLAYQLAESGLELDLALSLATRARSLAPKNAGAADTLGYIYLKRQLPAEAARLYRGLVKRVPGRARYHYYLARALAETGSKEEAGTELRIAITGRPRAREKGNIRGLLAQLGT